MIVGYMKTKLILFSIVCLMFGFYNSIQAQDSTMQTERFFERSINGQTYVYDTFIGYIKNKNNHIDKMIDPQVCEFGIKEIRSIESIFNEIFSAKRKEELKGVIFRMDLICDSLGNILEV